MQFGAQGNLFLYLPRVAIKWWASIGHDITRGRIIIWSAPKALLLQVGRAISKCTNNISGVMQLIGEFLCQVCSLLHLQPFLKPLMCKTVGRLLVTSIVLIDFE